MRSFRDGQNREWVVAATLGSLRRVKDAAGIDLLDDPTREIERVYQSCATLADVAWEMVRPAATAQGVDKDAFLEALNEPALLAARSAVMDELLDFFRERLPALKTLVEALKRVETAAVELLKKHAPRIEQTTQRLTAELEARLDRALTESAATTGT